MTTNKTYTGTNTSFYIADELTAKTVNLAIHLNRPILVEGEPGCGKTMLAYSVGKELGLEVVKFVVKSTTRALDLLYQEDNLRRLQDAQRPDNESSRYIYPYITLGRLGEAIHLPHQDNKRRVVLIDEVDKADIDFPNDLLGVLDGFKFDVEPLSRSDEERKLSEENNGFGYHIEAKPNYEPIIIITSNREKRLPEPFLRRCLYVRILFPREKSRLREIVLLNLKDKAEQVNQSILESAIDAFLKVRHESNLLDVQKQPTTSELIDWVRILNYEGVSADKIKEGDKYPPYWRLLFKTMNDIQAYNAHSDD